MEIKFRQPILNKDGSFKEWHYWGNIDEKNWVEAAIQMNGIDTRRKSQQYTGLKYKNGNDIYEGDVILCEKYLGGNFVEHTYHGGEVKKYGLLYRVVDHQKKFHENWQHLHKLVEYDYEFTIKGNIYENPDLLK